jgi:SAM-dependent methyltransferase
MVKPTRTPAYDDDLAHIHDVGFGGFADGSAPGLLQILKKAGIADGRVVDLGCGSGIWARHLSDAGYNVVGVDQSPAMIERARQRAPKAEFHVASFVQFELPPCRAITALGEVLCYQFDATNNRRSLLRFFRRAHDALEPGGLLIFDVAEPGLDRNRAPTFREGPDWACLLRFEYDVRRDHLIRHIATFRKVEKLYRRHEEVHRLHLYRRNDIAAMLRGVGFRVRTVRKYGAYALLPGRVGFVSSSV